MSVFPSQPILYIHVHILFSSDQHKKDIGSTCHDYTAQKTYKTSFPSMASVIPDQRLSHHLLSQCINLVHSFPPTSNISLNLQFGSFLFNFSHNPSNHIHLINNTSSHKKKRIKAPSDRRRDKLRKSKCALNDSQGTLAPAPGPPGTTSPALGPPGTTASAPGHPGTTAPAPGPPGTTAPATGPPGMSASAPGPQGTFALAPGPPGTSAPAQGPPGMSVCFEWDY